MEAFLIGLFNFWFVTILILWFLGLGDAAEYFLKLPFKFISAFGKSLFGKGSFKDNYQDAPVIMPSSFKIRVTHEKTNKNDGLIVWKVEATGPFPIPGNGNYASCVSIIDVTDKKDPSPVLSLLERDAELGSTVFQQYLELGSLKVNYGWTKWVQIGHIIPSMLIPPKSGKRKLACIIRLLPDGIRNHIKYGFCDDQFVVWREQITKTFFFKEKGYEEKNESRNKVRETTLKLAVCVASVDGAIQDEEGMIIKKWATNVISILGENKQKELKERYNSILKNAFQSAGMNELILSDLIIEMNNGATTQDKYEAIELCFDVMAADGVADAKELAIIKSLAEQLELDYEEVKGIRDRKLVGLELDSGSECNLEDMLGIDPDWPKSKICDYLLEEFRKWNSRVTNLPDGQERDSAQRRLDLIADARKKYC